MKEKAPRNTPETPKLDLSLANQRINALVDARLKKVRPLNPTDYDLDAIQPDLIVPDLRQMLVFVAGVESNPTDPAIIQRNIAIAAGATGKLRFLDQVWLPEESGHATVTYEMAIRSGGISGSAMDEHVNRIKERGFSIGVNYSLIQTDIYSLIQEKVARYSYNPTMKTGSGDPVINKGFTDLAGQESFHAHVYYEHAKAIFESNPQHKDYLADQVIEAVADFKLPGHHMFPELQKDSPKWAKRLGFPYKLLLKELYLGLEGLVGQEGVGKAIRAYASRNEMPWHLQALFLLARPLSNERLGKLAASRV